MALGYTVRIIEQSIVQYDVARFALQRSGPHEIGLSQTGRGQFQEDKDKYESRKSIHHVVRRLVHQSAHQTKTICSGSLPQRSSEGMASLPVSTGFVAI